MFDELGIDCNFVWYEPTEAQLVLHLLSLQALSPLLVEKPWRRTF